LCPGHHLEVEDEEIVEILFSIGASKDEDLGLVDQDGGMAVSGRWGAYALGSLQPCHGNWVECVQIPKYFAFLPSSPENDDFGTCQDSRMGVPGSGRSPRYLRFGKFISIDIQDIGIVEIGIALVFTRVVMSSKDDDGCS